MNDPATYRRFAEECRQIAAIGPDEDRRLLLEHAAMWTKLAEAAEHDRTKGDPNF
jgi:hypothetical protein